MLVFDEDGWVICFNLRSVVRVIVLHLHGGGITITMFFGLFISPDTEEDPE